MTTTTPEQPKKEPGCGVQLLAGSILFGILWAAYEAIQYWAAH